MRNDMKNRWIAMACLLWTSISAPSVAYADDAYDFEGLRDDIEALLDETGTPGVGVAIYDVERGSWARGIGVTSIKKRTPATATTRFRVGSVSKSFVSLMALKLQEKGRLSLNMPLTTLAPDITLHNPYAPSEPVRLIHLLEHTSGLEDIHLAEYAAKSSTSNVLEGLEHYTRSRHVRWKPGQAFSYSNAGPSMVAQAMENATGQEFELLAQNLLFDPLDMHATSWTLPGEQMSSGHAGSEPQEVAYAHIMLRPSGSLNTTPEDMTRLLRMLVHDGQIAGEEFVSPESLEQMRWSTSTESARHGVRVGWGVGSRVRVHGTHIMFGHSGGIDGFSASYAYIPGKVGWAIMSNHQSSGIISKIDDLLVKRLLEHQDISTLPSDRELDMHEMQALEGYYRAVGSRLDALRFISDLLGVYKVTPSERGVHIESLFGGAPKILIAQQLQGAFRGEDEPLATHWFDGKGHYYDYGERYERVSAVWTWFKIIGLALAMMLLFSTVPVLVVMSGWSVMKQRVAPSLQFMGLLSLMPLCMAWWIGALAGAGMSADPLTALGTPSPWSWSVCVGTIMYVVVVGLCTVATVRRSGKDKPHPVWRAYAWSVVVAGIGVSIYMWAYGLVGIRLWWL